MRPGLSGLSKMQLFYSNDSGPQKTVSPGSGGGGNGGTEVTEVTEVPEAGGPGSNGTYPCPKGSCVANPVIQEVSALPSGTSAPNTVITEHAVHQLGLQVSTAGWLIQTTHPPTAAQITTHGSPRPRRASPSRPNPAHPPRRRS